MQGQSVKNKQSGGDGPSDGPDADVSETALLAVVRSFGSKVKDLRFLIHAFDASIDKPKEFHW